MLCLFYGQNLISSNDFPEEEYQELFNLQPDTSLIISENPYKNLIDDYEDLIFILINDDKNLSEQFSERKDIRIKAIKNSDFDAYDKNLCIAEINLHWSLIEWRHGNYIKSGFLIKDSYNSLKRIDSRYSERTSHKKSFGLLNILLSAIPSEYQWLLEIFGLQNNFKRGLTDLSISAKDSFFQEEAQILLAYVYGFILEDRTASSHLAEKIRHFNNNAGNLYYLISCNKIARNELGLAFYKSLEMNKLAHYLKPYFTLQYAELLLKKGKYELAQKKFISFIDDFPGSIFKANARLKIAYCNILLDQKTANSSGNNYGEAFSISDRYATSKLKDLKSINKALLVSRLKFDGGYYNEALDSLKTYQIDPNHKLMNIEYYYRIGRIYQGLNKPFLSVQNLNKCVELQGDLQAYYAPSACLQIARMKIKNDQKEKAIEWLDKISDYKNYSYQRSLEHQAKSIRLMNGL